MVLSGFDHLRQGGQGQKNGNRVSRTAKLFSGKGHSVFVLATVVDNFLVRSAKCFIVIAYQIPAPQMEHFMELLNDN